MDLKGYLVNFSTYDEKDEYAVKFIAENYADAEFAALGYLSFKYERDTYIKSIERQKQNA
jgi:hypothetical protein